MLNLSKEMYRIKIGLEKLALHKQLMMQRYNPHNTKVLHKFWKNLYNYIF
jgi:hypothetical protein